MQRNGGRNYLNKEKNEYLEHLPSSFLSVVLFTLSVSVNLFRPKWGKRKKTRPRVRKKQTAYPRGASIGSNACYSAVRKWSLQLDGGPLTGGWGGGREIVPKGVKRRR